MDSDPRNQTGPFRGPFLDEGEEEETADGRGKENRKLAAQQKRCKAEMNK